MKGDLVKVFAEFFESEAVNACTNASSICSIPKKERSLEFRILSIHDDVALRYNAIDKRIKSPRPLIYLDNSLANPS